ncbi:hypothetical protein Tco_0681629 [Tanacetum coccineum]|uniref:Uncharacterized protein n=1 Tax=Tanacetum coccineum TaxID=301880 RepID=A0ABQ4XP10_9ASTR
MGDVFMPSVVDIAVLLASLNDQLTRLSPRNEHFPTTFLSHDSPHDPHLHKLFSDMTLLYSDTKDPCEGSFPKY